MADGCIIGLPSLGVELDQVSGSGLISHLNSELLSSSISSGATMNKPADVVVGKRNFQKKL